MHIDDERAHPYDLVPPEQTPFPGPVTMRLLTLAQLVLLVAKLTGRMDWSWWWVLLPSWIVPLGLAAVLIALVLLEKIHYVILRLKSPKP